MTKKQSKRRVSAHTNEEIQRIESLGRRALACAGWEWMAGMLALSSKRGIWVRVVDPPREKLHDCFPDLSDPATIGCLLTLVREAWNDPTLGAFAVRGGRSGRPARAWALGGVKPRRRGFDNSIASAFFGDEMEALVSALEAAP
jgi:hypothetical protein